MCLYTALSMSFPFQCPAFPPGCKGQHPEPVQRGFHTTGPEPIHVPGGHTTLPGCGRWSRPPTEAIKAGYPVFEHRNLANICETTVLCLLHTRVSRQAEKPCLHIQCRQGFWKGRYPFTGKSRLFQEQEDSSDSPSLIKAKLVLPAQLLHQVHGESLATAWMFHEP